jgi:hypothetical protein
MEQWCMISHGTAQMLKERSLDVSDLYKVHICDKCGLIAKADIKEGIYECSSCNNNLYAYGICTSLISVLLLHELHSYIPSLISAFAINPHLSHICTLYKSDTSNDLSFNICLKKKNSITQAL